MNGLGIGEAVRRSGLTREQIVYLDERNLLGVVARRHEARRFSEEQVLWLERYSTLRQMGLGGDHAVALATAQSARGVEELIQLCAVVDAKAREIQRTVAAWVYVCSLITDSVSVVAAEAVGRIGAAPG
jgi:DNA-binding transcriptional MerR regulator